jgi:hypothetical protein
MSVHAAYASCPLRVRADRRTPIVYLRLKAATTRHPTASPAWAGGRREPKVGSETRQATGLEARSPYHKRPAQAVGLLKAVSRAAGVLIRFLLRRCAGVVSSGRRSIGTLSVPFGQGEG